MSWIGLRDPWSGIAHVFVDGVLRSTVDTYSALQQSRATLFSVSGLPAGTHTIRIEVTGTRGPGSSGAWVWIDALDVAS